MTSPTDALAFSVLGFIAGSILTLAFHIRWLQRQAKENRDRAKELEALAEWEALEHWEKHLA